jgi:hypothetical protein
MQAPSVFISHASEDKDLLAEPIARHLSEMGCLPWLDKEQLVAGDSLTSRIGSALRDCNYAVLVVTHSFLQKSWPRQELRVLLARELNERRSIVIPVLHGVNATDLIDEFQLLLDRLWITSNGNILEVTKQINAALRNSPAVNTTDAASPSTRTSIGKLLTTEGYDDDLAFLFTNAENEIDRERLQRAIDREGRILVLLSAAPAGSSTCDTNLQNKIHLGHLWMMRYIERLSRFVPKSKIVLSALPEYNYLTQIGTDEKRYDFVHGHLMSWQQALSGIASTDEISSSAVDHACEGFPPAKAEHLARAQALFEALALHVDLSDQGKSELLRWRLGKIDSVNSVTLARTVQKVKKIARRLDTASDSDVALSLAYLTVFKWQDYGLSWLKLVAYLANDSSNKETLILESSKNSYVWRAAEYAVKRFKLGRFPKLVFLKPVTDQAGLPIKGSLSTEYSLSQLQGYLSREDHEARRHHDELVRKFSFDSFSELKAYIGSKRRMAT